MGYASCSNWSLTYLLNNVSDPTRSHAPTTSLTVEIRFYWLLSTTFFDASSRWLKTSTPLCESMFVRHSFNFLKRILIGCFLTYPTSLRSVLLHNNYSLALTVYAFANAGCRRKYLQGSLWILALPFGTTNLPSSTVSLHWAAHPSVGSRHEVFWEWYDSASRTLALFHSNFVFRVIFWKMLIYLTENRIFVPVFTKLKINLCRQK